MENIDFSEVFKDFITHYPFKGEFHMFYYSQFMNGKPNLEEFHQLINWYHSNINGLAIEILKSNKKVVNRLNREHSKRWRNERDRAKLMVPSIKSLEKVISMFDND
ncbi:MAG: hypothetical protein IPL31_10485 [Saprospiraceae bacterium]|nr:hypothetical protein [Saprospiraceae bacterium]